MKDTRKRFRGLFQEGRIGPRPSRRIVPFWRVTGWHFIALARHSRLFNATSLPGWSFLPEMKSESHLDLATKVGLERQVIRIDVPSANAGITAALRRAFAPVEDECRDRDFDELLRRLN